MGYDKPIFQDDKPVNMFEVIFPLAKKEERTAQVPHKLHTSTTQAPHKSDIIWFCAEPRSFKEIMERLGLKNRVYVFKDYVSPLVVEGLIALTIPDKPKSPRQKYVITRKGKSSLDKGTPG